MTRSNVLFTAIALSTFVVGTAKAETANKTDETPSFQLKSNAKGRLLTQALLAPVYAFTMLNMHEGSHALMAEIVGVKVTAFKPYPHLETFDGKKSLCFASMSNGPTNTSQEKLILVAPMITDLAVFTATDLALSYAVDADSALAPVLLIAGMIAPLVDVFTNANGWTAQNDVSRIARLTGTPRWAWQTTGDALIAVGAWRILSHGRDILFETGTAKSRSNVALLPMLNGSLGATVVGRF